MAMKTPCYHLSCYWNVLRKYNSDRSRELQIMTNADTPIFSTESPTLIAIKPEQKARSIMSDLQREDPERIPILEVLDSQNEVAGGEIKRAGYIPYEDLATHGKNRSFFTLGNTQGNGTLTNLKSAYAEAIILNQYRSELPPGYGLVMYEPMKQGALQVDRIFGSSIAGSFNGKTPDIIMSVPRKEIQMGTKKVTICGRLAKVVDEGQLINTPKGQPAPLTTRIYQNTDLIAPIEVTTSSRSGDIRGKIEKFEAYRNAGDSKTSYVPVLVMDEYVFNKKISRAKQIEYVARMKAIGGVIVLESGLNAAAERKALKAANRLQNVMNLRDRADAQENEPSAAGASIQVVEITTNSEQKLNDNIPNSNASAGSASSTKNTEQPNQSLPEESIASRRYQAIKVLLEKAGMEEGKNPDWVKGILLTAVGTGLKNRDVQDIVEEIPGMQATQAAKLVGGLSQQQILP
jgi:hypothetical protein